MSTTMKIGRAWEWLGQCWQQGQGPGGGENAGCLGNCERHITVWQRVGKRKGGKGKGEAAEVFVDTMVHVRNMGLTRGRKWSHLINLGTIWKYHNFILAIKDPVIRIGSFLWFQKHLIQNKNISVLGAKTKALEPELKFLLQSHVLP